MRGRGWTVGSWQTPWAGVGTGGAAARRHRGHRSRPCQRPSWAACSDGWSRPARRRCCRQTPGVLGVANDPSERVGSGACAERRPGRWGALGSAATGRGRTPSGHRGSGSQGPAGQASPPDRRPAGEALCAAARMGVPGVSPGRTGSPNGPPSGG